MNLVNVLNQSVNERPDSIAFIEGIEDRRRTVTFYELFSESEKVIVNFKRAGIEKGDNVLIMLPMSIDLYVALVSLWRIGAVAVFLDPAFGKEYINKCCETISIKGFVGTFKASLFAATNKNLRRIPAKLCTSKLYFSSEYIFSNNDRNFKEIIELENDFPALITFTSGSTGTPKVAVRTHGFLLKQYEIIKKELNIKIEDIDFNSLPIFALVNLGSGAVTVIPNMTSRQIIKTKPESLVKQLEDYNVNRAIMPPALAEKIIKYCEEKSIILKKITRFYTGGGPVFEKLIKRIKNIMPNARIYVVYGSTEAEPISEIEWDSISQDEINAVNNGKGLIVGKPIEEINLKILKVEEEKRAHYDIDFFNQSNLSVNKVGEIIVNGEHVLKGYLNGIGDADNKIRVEKEIWHRTGDLGCLDDKGQLWLLGRVGSSVMNKKGEVIYSFAVENVINNITGVKKSALLNFKKQCILVLSVEENIDRKLIDENILNFGIDKVCFLDKIPLDKRHNSKIDYPALIKEVNKIYKT